MTKYFISLIILFVIDRSAKIYQLKNPSSDGFFQLHLNQNIAFSWPLPIWIIYPAVIIILFIIIWLWLIALRQKSSLIWPWGLIIIGAVSNLLDRISYQGVIDFINIEWFTVFNVADVYISLGVAWILIFELFINRKQKN
jgi:signal peptidase II